MDFEKILADLEAFWTQIEPFLAKLYNWVITL